MGVLGLRFLGRAAVLAASFVARATSYEGKRRLAPTVAAVCRDVRIRVLKEWRWFLGEYRKALTAWRGGERAAVPSASLAGSLHVHLFESRPKQPRRLDTFNEAL